jgi:GH18 family chitinase
MLFLPAVISQPVIVGYLPQYSVANVSEAALGRCTDVAYFSLEPNADGSINEKNFSSSHMEKLMGAKKKHGFRLLITVGGWGRSSGFAAATSTKAGQKNLASNLVDWCEEYGFDGVDYDWEHPKNAEEAANYAGLIKATKDAGRASNLLVTAALAGWQTITPEGVEALDRVHLMAYDQGGRHSTLRGSISDVDKMIALGFPKPKIAMGVPFYGRHVEKRNSITYASLLERNRSAILEEGLDEVDGMYFNGPATMKQKCDYAKAEGLAGIMIWELGHDAAGDDSLLSLIHKELTPKPVKKEDSKHRFLFGGG